MDPSNRRQTPKNLSTRWKCRPDRNLGGPESYQNLKKTRTRRADMKPLDEAQRELAARFLPLARALARPLKEMFAQWRDEFESAACLALVEAARSFDPSRNIQFATFARFRIRGALVDVGRQMSLAGWEDDENGPGAVSLTPYSEEHGQVLIAFKPPRIGTEFDDIDAVEHMLKKLPKKHATVCRLQYLYGKTQSEIAAVLGCSQTEVTRLHLKALEFLSEPYDTDGKVNSATWRRRAGRTPTAEGLRTEDSGLRADSEHQSSLPSPQSLVPSPESSVLSPKS
jgi:RNA polymerase sigma factor (sigma-70 family)